MSVYAIERHFSESRRHENDLPIFESLPSAMVFCIQKNVTGCSSITCEERREFAGQILDESNIRHLYAKSCELANLEKYIVVKKVIQMSNPTTMAQSAAAAICPTLDVKK
jgi:hypothetical protein